MSRGRLAVLVIALGLIGSQAGHLVAYQLRYGAAAQSLQSTGAHGYFPTIVKTGLGLAAAFMLVALTLIGLARLAAGRRIEGGEAPPFLRLVALLFSLQLGLFIVQETAEAAAGSASPVSPDLLLMWGAVGQLPAALLAALVVRWLCVRLRPALGQLRSRPRPVLGFGTHPSALVVWQLAREPMAADERLVSAFRRRGPPF